MHNFKGSGSTPRGTIPDLWEYSRKSGIALLGVLPDPLKSYTGSTLGEYSRKSGIVLLGVLPQAQNSSNGSTPRPALGVVEVTSNDWIMVNFHMNSNDIFLNWSMLASVG